MRKLLFTFFIMLSVTWAQDKTDNSPKVFGYVRSWYQADLQKNQGEFLVKMSRLGVKGSVNEYASYKLLVDFSRLGSLQSSSDTVNGKTFLTGVNAKFSDALLDAEAIIKPTKSFSLSLGQFKVPFGTDNLRAASAIDFINRPLLTKVAPGLRDIGVMGSYAMKSDLPIEINAGLFNGAGQNQAENDKAVNYSARAVVSPLTGLALSVNYYGGQLSGGDLSIFDLGADYEFGNFFLSGEYGQRSFDLKSSETLSNSYFIYGFYDIKFEDSFVSHLMPALRYETYDANTDKDNDAINRITTGLTLQFAKINSAQFRINYEIFDYEDGRDNPDKLIFEIQVKF